MQPISRREAIRRSLLFSAALLTPSWIDSLPAQILSSSPGIIDLLGWGDWGNGSPSQKAVAAQIHRYISENHLSPQGVFLIGDNFYKALTPERWENEFEKMYDSQLMPCPFWACLGNHDYGTHDYDFQVGKGQMQLDYSKLHPESRWRMPSKWYSISIPEAQPLLRVLVIDTNLDCLTPEEKKAQDAWLKKNLEESASSPFLIVMGHHPMFSNGVHGDNPELQKAWGDLFKTYQVPIYLAGHDHDLQHLRIEGWPTDFVISGGGGADNTPMRRDGRGELSLSVHGFTHFQLSPSKLVIRYIDVSGKMLHQFEVAPRKVTT